MEKDLGHHILQRFDEELQDVRNRVLAMGGLVEQQIIKAITSLAEGDSKLAQEVIDNDVKVNSAEVVIDEECTQILARRQPEATDLRLLVTVIKTITDLERIGDKAKHIAQMSQRLIAVERPKNQYNELKHLGKLVAAMVHDVVDAFARMDFEAAIEIARRDLKVDREYEAVMRQAVTFMMEDSHTVTRMLDVMWTARAIERIGDHAKNICEYIIYLVKGKDVRHTGIEKMATEVSL